MATEIIRPCALYIAAPHVVTDDSGIIAICLDPVTARRVADLVDRHGLIDVPDDLSGIDLA